jgi:hypothetical protein
MRQGPTNASRDFRARPTPPHGVDPARAGIRSLDCGDDDAPPTTVIRRAASDAAPGAAPKEDGSLGEQRQAL